MRSGASPIFQTGRKLKYLFKETVAMTTNNLDTTPRFKGCPPICEAENLPAFKTEKDIGKFIDTNCPGASGKIWQCKTCGLLHFSSEKVKEERQPEAENTKKSASKSRKTAAKKEEDLF
jgi:hypothetical protein